MQPMHTSAANATSTAGGGNQTIVVMPLGSSSSTGGQGYQPDQITVSPGATVMWDNQDNALHTATSGNPDTATPDGKFDTGIIGANQQSKPVTMPTEPGDYVYFCTTASIPSRYSHSTVSRLIGLVNIQEMMLAVLPNLQIINWNFYY